MEIPADPNLIVGLETFEDAGVYQLSDVLAIIQTVDFFTPIVDDPYSFGQIAAANALSDVYAMGGRPVTAMNIVCFPGKTMEISILKEVLRGGLDKINEAGVTLVGGHSVNDPELKYGLSVTGIIHPDNVILNSGARPGDRLILTKPLGTGIINTAIKAGKVDEQTIDDVTAQMAMLNKKAAELMQEVGVNACTDVTGFGLLGHACEMIQSDDLAFEIDHAKVPILRHAIKSAQMGLIPGGAYRNREFHGGMVEFASDIPQWAGDVLFDPQTSGGLLIAVSAEKAEALLEKMRNAGVDKASIIGSVTHGVGTKIVIK